MEDFGGRRNDGAEAMEAAQEIRPPFGRFVMRLLVCYHDYATIGLTSMTKTSVLSRRLVAYHRTLVTLLL